MLRDQSPTPHIAYIYSDEYRESSDLLPSNINRSSLVHSLIKSYGLFNNMDIIPPEPAEAEEIALFHSREYLDFLFSCDFTDEREIFEQEKDRLSEFGLLHDCPVFPKLLTYVELLAGASLLAAELLLEGKHTTVINWEGGRHHAKSGSASGFCYINDINLSILKLLEGYRRVLYIDLDLHHGDGVEEAFYYSSQVYTVSLHRHDPGFYPGTGSFESVGRGRGKNYCLNLPLKSGLCDANFVKLFDEVVQEVTRTYCPEVVVVQCGVDGLSGDRHREWNLTINGFSSCLHIIKSWNLPTLYLGGGGYNHPNVSRCYAQLTSLIVESPLITQEDNVVYIPEHQWFNFYKSDFTLQIEKGPHPDQNSKEYINDLILSAKNQIAMCS